MEIKKMYKNNGIQIHYNLKKVEKVKIIVKRKCKKEHSVLQTFQKLYQGLLNLLIVLELFTIVDCVINLPVSLTNMEKMIKLSNF